MDWVVQKAVELGVSAIQPLASVRSVVRLNAERAVRRADHWQQVAVAACEQSGRNRPPVLQPLMDLSFWLTRTSSAEALHLFLSPHEGQRLSDFPESESKSGLVLLIGPEGGFEEDEVAQIRMAGFQAARLGPRVLRTETAGLATLAAAMALWGDF